MSRMMKDNNINLFITLVLWYISCCQGLKLIMNRDISTAPGTRTMCGILLCKETLSPSGSATSKQDDNSTKTFPGRISRMSIVKKVPRMSRAGQDEDGLQVHVASVTQVSPTTTRKKNGVKLLGVLEPQQASMRVELFKRDDCLAEFTCQVTGVDSQGREFFSSSTLLQQEAESRNFLVESGRFSSAGAAALQLVAQQLDAKMEQVMRSVENLEDKIERNIVSTERRLEDKIESVEEDVRDRMDSFERVTFERRLEDKQSSLENRLEDKINHRLLDKLHDSDVTLRGLKNNNTQSTSESVILERLTVLFKNQESFQITQAKTFDQLTYLEEKLEIFENSTDLGKEVAVVGNIINEPVANDIISSNQELLNGFLKLEGFLFNTSRETQSALSGLPSQIGTTLAEHLKSVIEDIFAPKTCKKGMVAFSSEPSYPHLLIRADDNESGNEAPYLCDTVTDGGGWILIQRRTTGNVDFYRTWEAYKTGFGSLDDDFWLGNERIHAFTSNGTWELRVDLKYNGKAAFAHYSNFFVASEKAKYKLNIGAYDGTAGDSLRYHNGRAFSTFDSDNDGHSSNCAKGQIGGWWYNACDFVDLNSKWNGGKDKGLEWKDFTGSDSASFSEMKIRRVNG